MLASPPDHERLVAEIYFDGKFVALVSQENESGPFVLETPGPDVQESEVLRKVDLEGFTQAVKAACLRLKRGLK